MKTPAHALAHASWLMAGMVAGGLAGAYVARVIPAKVARGLIVLVGAALTIVFAKLYWFDA